MLDPKEKLNLPALEERVLAFWKDEDIFKKSLTAREGGPEFVFYEGPPTANARPGTHHVIGRAFKDVIPRYKAMRGYHVPRRAGWDTHGLPVEIEVEKELGLKSKPEIETYGIAAFNAKAKASVWKYKEEWERLTERVGFWLDIEHPYITYDNAYVEKLWGVVKKVDERGLLYKGHKVVPWCARCGTALSSHELAQGYKEVTDTAAYVRFEIRSPKFETKTSIVAWTTTPWTLLGNVALAINPAHTFVAVKDGDETFILEKGAAVRMGLSFEREFPASELIGLSYEPLFEISGLKSEKSWKIYSADFVTAESGTGVVHTAVMYGEDDYALGMAVGLPQFHTVDEAGNFTDAVPGFAGLRAKNATTEEKILADLKSRGRLMMKEPYAHEYPFCWRCGTAVLYYATDAWFIAMSTLRAELAAANETVNWTPEHIKEGRFGEWLRNVKDWALSRARYWGTPLPVWECPPCGTYTVIGSLAELPSQPKDSEGSVDVHRPFIDSVMIPCKKCGGAMARVKDVIDVWFDSGAMPFASEEFPARYPADYICEAIDQTRGWFYTLMAIGVLMERGAPYKNVTCYSHLLDKAGKKMSKSKGNGVDPWELMNAHGADAVRWHFYSSAIVKEAQKFDERDFGKGARSLISLIYNSFVFLETYGDAETRNLKPEIRNVLDRWIMSRLAGTAKGVADHLDRYEIAAATSLIETFADDLSRWYLRRSRKRAEALPVLRHVLIETSKIIAPFMPFFAEALYKSLGGPLESVHMEDWPLSDARIDEGLDRGMAEVRRIASLALAVRAEKGIKVRQPLRSLTIRTMKSEIRSDAELLSILADEVNVKEVLFEEGVEAEVVLDSIITPELENEGVYRDLVRMAQGLRQQAGSSPQDAVVFHVEAGERARAVLEPALDSFKKDVNARDIVFERTDAFAAEATEEIGGASAWVGIVR